MLDLSRISRAERPTAFVIERTLRTQWAAPDYRLTRAKIPMSPQLRAILDVQMAVVARPAFVFPFTERRYVHLCGPQVAIGGLMVMYLASILGSDNITREGN